MNPAMLPVRPHLHPRPRRDPLAAVPPGIRAKPSAAFADTLARAPVFEHGDPTKHPLGWHYDIARFVPLELGSPVPWRGEA